jgi:NitT/TauT family transport system ATP-binding protein
MALANAIGRMMATATTSARGGALRIEHAGKTYDPEGERVVALDDVSFETMPGEFCVVVGPSGCGKTTLLNAIAGFDQLTAGEIYLDDDLLTSPGKRLLPGADRMVVFQQGALFPWKTVLWNVTCGPIQQGKMSRSEAELQGRELLGRVGLRQIEDQFPGELSGGMKRRVEIVRALMNDPKVLLLDEPFRALDALTKSVVQEYLLELYDLAPKTVFFITHDVEEAVFLADKVVVMTTRPGRVLKIVDVDIGRPRDYHVLTSPRFLALENEVRAAIYDEARKAFEAGERELA